MKGSLSKVTLIKIKKAHTSIYIYNSIYYIKSENLNLFFGELQDVYHGGKGITKAPYPSVHD